MPAWRWRGEDRITGEVKEYFTSGPQFAEAEVREHIEEHYRGLRCLLVWPSDKPPLVLVPMKPRYYHHGILDLVRRELGAGKRGAARSFGEIRPILNPLARKELSHGSSRPGPIKRILCSRNPRP